jgi:hypothetical protein
VRNFALNFYAYFDLFALFNGSAYKNESESASEEAERNFQGQWLWSAIPKEFDFKSNLALILDSSWLLELLSGIQ